MTAKCVGFCKFSLDLESSSNLNNILQKPFTAPVGMPSLFLLKGGKAFGTTQAGVINPKAYLAGLRTKRGAFARFMNKAFGEDDDFKPVDPDNIDFEAITEYLNAQQVQLIKPNYGEDGENLPQRTIIAMYNEEVMPAPDEAQAAEDQNFIEGGIEAVKDLLKKFKENIHLIKGNSNNVLQKIDMKKIDFVFIDGGHEYNTVVNDLNHCKEVINLNGTVLCDDYNLGSAPGVKEAIDEFVNKNQLNVDILCENRFAKIQK